MKRRGFLLIVVLSLTSFVFGQSDPPAPPPAAAKLPSTISGGVLNGKATSLPKPAYPPAARAVNAEGAVSVQVLIDEQGMVISANAVSGHPLLRAAAADAARGARFSPTLLQSQPVKVSGVITYSFILPKPESLPGEGLLAIVPPEDHDKIWVLGFMFSFVQEADTETLKLIGDEKEFFQILKDLGTDIPPELKNYAPMLAKLSSSDMAVRSNAAREFLTLLRPELDAEKTWQVDVGGKLSVAVLEVLRQKTRNEKMGEPYNLTILKGYLKDLSDSMSLAPKNSSAQFRSAVQKFLASGDRTDLSGDEQMTAMFQALEPLFAAFDGK